MDLIEQPATRFGDWLQTYSGRQFWPMDPRPDEIHVEDIAHALSLACRYAGHCQRFYSVAEHSVLVASKVAPEHRLWALLHDASEAYLTDVPRPVKPYLTGYRDAEDRLMSAVCERFGLPVEMPAVVKRADNAILNDERAQNMRFTRHEWAIDPTPLGVTLQFWSPTQAEAQWRQAFEQALDVNIAWPASFEKVSQNLNTWAEQIHSDNTKWWADPATGKRIERNDGELLMLMVSEIAEGMEGLRKDLMDDKLPHRPMIEVEMADLFIRLMDFAGARKLDLDGAVAEKRAFNAVRKDHTFEARLAANGKKF